MNVAVLGSGIVGRTIAGKVAALGHDVALGTRDVEALMARPGGAAPYDRQPFSEWHEANPAVRVNTFADAATYGEIVFNATAGMASLEALQLAGGENLDGKILIDISNPLDFSQGMPPWLSVSNTDSLGEQIQRAFPEARVVKTLNTVNAFVMIDPMQVGGGDHHIFVSGNDPEAKAAVVGILQDWFGWRHIIDLGDITTARGPEMYLPLWVRLLTALGTGSFNVKVVT